MSEKINIKILVAPLDWGLGHATRCIPIITQLLQLGCKIIIAAEGAQEKLLKTEFPQATFVYLPGYQISYSTNERFFAAKIILQLPKIYFSIKREHKWLKRFLTQTPVDAIISDNRYGFYDDDIPSVFITHQLLIKAPFAAVQNVLQRVNYSLINRFNQCWVPDQEGKVSLAGVLSHPIRLPQVKVAYLGGLSRLTRSAGCKKTYDLLIIISGPEPQRTLLEEKMLSQLGLFKGTVLLVRGLPAKEAVIKSGEKIIIKNHLPAKELEMAFCESELIISRSGYTTVMDVLKMRKKAVLIPTPGQTEQEYLADHLHQQGWCLCMKQEAFSLKELFDRVSRFNFRIPALDMEAYKEVVDSFVKELC
ncbi:MAG: glycosyl transferase family 28 [Bacteroidota bacterium]|nr:glycosyl transferase family 28 [Bacteroidota bacterium]